MPRRSYNSKADFDLDYNIGVEPEGHPNTRPKIRMGYSRAAMMPYAENRAAKMVELFAWPLNTKILIVGAGYGWTAEVLETQYGYTDIVTTDTSPHVQSTQDQSDETEVNDAITAVGLDPNQGEGAAKKSLLWSPGNRRRHSRSIQNEQLNNGGSRNRIRNILGGVDVAISEDVIATLDDSEVTQMAGWVDAVDSNVTVIHMTTELYQDGTQDPLFNWKTLADWKLLVPSHTFVSLNTWEVL